MNAHARRIGAARLVDLLGPVARPANQWLSERVRTMVADGSLLHETRLPSERDLAQRLGLSRTTVTSAYADLRERGFAVARHGSGTVVRVPGGQDVGGGEPMLLGGLDRPDRPDVIDLTTATPSAVAGLAEAYAQEVEHLGRYAAGGGYYPVGIPELRNALARRYTERGLATVPDQILVTTGAVEALATVARTVLRRGDRVVVESPGYPNSIGTLRQEGARPVPVATGPTGTDPASLDAAFTSVGARFALALPDFHNPTGVLTDDAGRRELAHLWRRHGVTGIVDETTAELSLDDAPLPAPMAAHARDALTVGSVSKSLWGGLRVGWLRVPGHQVDAFARARLTMGLGAPVLEQLVAARMIGDAATVLAHRRRELRSARDLLVSAMARELPEFSCRVPQGGLSSWWRLPRPLSSQVVRRARGHGLLLAPGSAFAVSGRGLEQWLRLPYAVDPTSLEEAVHRLARAWSELPDADGARPVPPAVAAQ